MIRNNFFAVVLNGIKCGTELIYPASTKFGLRKRKYLWENIFIIKFEIYFGCNCVIRMCLYMNMRYYAFLSFTHPAYTPSIITYLLGE